MTNTPPTQRARGWRIIEGDCLPRLHELETESVQTCVTSPPYWGLRDYGTDGQLGLEPTPEEYVENLVNVFREVRRVLRDDGTLWLNLGDSYAGSWGSQGRQGNGGQMAGRAVVGARISKRQIMEHPKKQTRTGAIDSELPLKPKDLVGIPWRVAFALQADGWWLRSDIIWAKPNPMPESVTDRPTRSHEYIFLLSKSARYFYDAEAIREQDLGTDHPRNILHKPEPSGGILPQHSGIRREDGRNGHGRNKRSVWTINTQPYAEAHFATFPPKLIEPCILAGSSIGDTVLDPFAGAGTTGLVALRHNRDFIGIELNPDYCELARNRIRDDAPLLNVHTELEAVS